MEWVASTLHTTSEHGVSSITTADAHTSPVSSRLNWRPRRFKVTRPFRRKTKSGFCACAITFQPASTKYVLIPNPVLEPVKPSGRPIAIFNTQNSECCPSNHTTCTILKTSIHYSRKQIVPDLRNSYSPGSPAQVANEYIHT